MTDADGERVRRAVLGDAHVDRSNAARTDFDRDFGEFITEYAWGGVWSRPGLDTHTRRLLTIGVLCSLGCEDELVMHVRAALDDGVSADEVKEVLLHTAVYAGLPRANRAFHLAGRVVAEHDVAEDGVAADDGVDAGSAERGGAPGRDARIG
ncbi:4-carboxymuconolactone decarboxylase [Glycomyces dulcitolivorans]|uniref:4-carboxymuconolactone decarboxylase n=1 Tax=Glycomyces dulcitolivorans TaxID=2200759 RepID=UPI000DD4CA0D|nr:4-carboxymuconolactone decarboxylase [Glycomyces dulcitolivorans]